jgi:lipoprotein-anchoring transpeptidase ErfK/SrfK
VGATLRQEFVMRRVPGFLVSALLSLSALALGPADARAATADGLALPAMSAPPAPHPAGGGLGGGFIEFILTGQSGDSRPARQGSAAPSPAANQALAALTRPAPDEVEARPSGEFLRREVDYSGPERPGTIVIDTPNKFLFLVLPHGRAMRYGVGVGRPGFEWSGVKTITRKAEWPGWTPPPQMMLRRPDLPSHMDGGPENPLGARALYLGSSMFRIHGTNEPSTIGQNVSSGCIRMMNEDVIDLYDRVPVGTKVIVM